MTKKTEATSNGSMLIVGFHTATPALVWRLDLERNHSFGLSLQGEEGDWELGITSPKGDYAPVAHFAAREDAEDALAKVEQALSKKVRTGSIIGKVFIAIAAAAAFVVFSMFLFGLFLNHRTGDLVAAMRASPPPGAAALVAPQEGVPQSADDVLRPPH
jgi:hypothetical protein